MPVDLNKYLQKPTIKLPYDKALIAVDNVTFEKPDSPMWVKAFGDAPQQAYLSAFFDKDTESKWPSVKQSDASAFSDGDFVGVHYRFFNDLL